MKITRIKNSLTVILNDGDLLTTSSCTDEMYEDVLAHKNDEDVVRGIIMPQYVKQMGEIQNKLDLLENFNKSEYLSAEGNSVFIKSISNLSLPGDLAMAVWNAEQEDNIELLSTYLNFWTLASLNPDAEARTNLFWFLNRYGMSISRSGLFIAYRNVVLKDKGSGVSQKWVKFITESFTHVRHKLKRTLESTLLVKMLMGKEFVLQMKRNLLK